MSSRKNRRGHGSVRPESRALEDQYFGGATTDDHKDIRLCKQVEEAISMALVSSADPILRDLYVVGVEPLRGAALLRVLVATDNKEEIDADRINQKLDRALGYFRGEVAKAITRKRVPGLKIALIPRGEEVDDDSNS